MNMPIDSGIINSIIKFGILAPSGDNSQPWRFVVDNNEVEIIKVPSKDNPIYNINERGTLLAIGALIENIIIAATHYKLRVEENYLPLIPGETSVVRLSFFEDGNIQESPLFNFLEKRVTNRFVYKNVPLSEAQKNPLFGCLKEIPSVSVHFVEEKNSRKEVAKNVTVSDLLLFENQQIHDSFFGDILWTEEEEKKIQKGFYIKTIKLSLPQLFIFKKVSSWNFSKKFSKIGLHKMIAKSNAAIDSTGAAYCALSVVDKDEEFIKLGKAIEKIWLMAGSMGISLQPTTAITYLAKYIKEEKNNVLSERQRKMVISAESNLKKIFSVAEHNRILGFIFRVGISNFSGVRTSRISPAISNEKL